MKKIISFISIAFLALSFVGCSSGDEPTESATDRQIKEIAAVLNGTFFATVDGFVGSFDYELTFTPYSSPKQEEFTISGIEKNVTVYGECLEKEYYKDNLQASTEWRYIINIAYEGAQPQLWLYPIGVYGRYETHDITIINNSSFLLDDITYTKQ